MLVVFQFESVRVVLGSLPTMMFFVYMVKFQLHYLLEKFNKQFLKFIFKENTN